MLYSKDSCKQNFLKDIMTFTSSQDGITRTRRALIWKQPKKIKWNIWKKKLFSRHWTLGNEAERLMRNGNKWREVDNCSSSPPGESLWEGTQEEAWQTTWAKKMKLRVRETRTASFSEEAPERKVLGRESSVEYWALRVCEETVEAGGKKNTEGIKGKDTPQSYRARSSTWSI